MNHDYHAMCNKYLIHNDGLQNADWVNKANLIHNTNLQNACAAAMANALSIANKPESRLARASRIAAEVRARRPHMQVTRIKR